MRIGDRVDRAVRLGSRHGTRRLVPFVVFGEVGREVANKRIERLRSEELDGVLPLIGADELRVSNDLECCRFEGFIQLAKALFLAVLEPAVEVISRGSLVGDFVDVMMEGLWVLDGLGDGVILIV